MPTINSTPQLSTSQQEYIDNGSKTFSADHKASPLEILQNVYKEINPQYGAGGGAEEMTTAVLVQKLENISHAESSAQTTPVDNLFERLDTAFLRKTLVLEPNVNSRFYDDSKKNTAIKLSYKNLFSILGGKLLIKGSSIRAIKQNSLLGKNNAKQDLDAYIVVDNLSDKLTIDKLVKALRSVPDFNDSNLSDEELVSLYTRENTNSNQTAESPDLDKLAFLRKFRLNVDVNKCIPIDLCFFTRLPAEFDRLGKGSDQMHVDIHNKRATERVLLDEYVQDWLEAEKYIWLHDDMTNGLIRIQKHFKKTPDLRLLQSGIIGKHYDQATPLERLSFIKAILDDAGKKNEPPPRLAVALSGLAVKFLELPLSDPREQVNKDILLGFMGGSPNSLNIANPDEALTIGKSLLTCLRIADDFSKFFYKTLRENVKLLPSGQQIDSAFPNPMLADLSYSWSKLDVLKEKRTTVNSAKQITTILEPMTLQVLGDYLFKSGHSDGGADAHQQHSRIIDLLLHVVNKEENVQQRISMLALKIETSDDNAKKKAVNSLISLAKTLGKPTDTAGLITASKAEILNALATQPLRGKQLADVKKLYASELLCPGKDIAQHDLLNKQAKSVLLLWQLQAELDAFVALSVPQDLVSSIGQDRLGASIDVYEHRASALRGALGTLQDISDSIKIDDQCYPVVLNTGSKALVLSTANHRCLITEDYLHIGKFKIKHKKGEKDSVITATIKGEGVQWRNTQQLHVGQFEGDQLSGVGKVLTKNILFNGEVSKDSLGVGLMMLGDPGSLKSELAPITTFMSSDGRLHETLGYTPKNRSSSFQYSLSGDFNGCKITDLTKISHDDFPDLKVGVTNADVILSVEREGGRCLKAYIDKHEGENRRYLYFPLASDDKRVAHIVADRAEIVDLSAQKRVCGTLDMDTQRIEGSGYIVFLDKKDNIHYNGSLINFTPTGFGRLYPEDAPGGIFAYREAGNAVDSELDDLFRVGNIAELPANMRPQKTLLYDLPKRDENAVFSLLDESGNKVFGVWSQGQIIGNMRKVSGSIVRDSTGVIFSLPEAICEFAEGIGINFGDDVLVMEDKTGMQHRFIPIGNHTVEEFDASSQTRTNTQTVSYALGRTLPEQFTASDFGPQSAEISGGQYAVISKAMGFDTIYIGETIAVERAGEIYQVPHGKGVSVSRTQLCKGSYKDGEIDGAAWSLGIDGSRFRGLFKNSEPSFGEMTLLNRIKITGKFRADQAWGEVKMVIPSYPKARTFEFEVADGFIKDSVVELLGDGRNVQFKVQARDVNRSRPMTWDVAYQALVESGIRVQADERHDKLLPYPEDYMAFVYAMRQELKLDP